MNKAIFKMFSALVAFTADLDKRDRGATATEYALLVALIALVIFVAVQFFGNQLSDFFHAIGSTVQGWT